MTRLLKFNTGLLIVLLMLVGQSVVGTDVPAGVEKLMTYQLDAVAANDREAFIRNGNKAFREMMDEWSFDSIVMQRMGRFEKGYRLEYLGMIERLGMEEHVWRVRPNGYKYQLLGRLSVADGKVVGFILE